LTGWEERDSRQFALPPATGLPVSTGNNAAASVTVSTGAIAAPTHGLVHGINAAIPSVPPRSAASASAASPHNAAAICGDACIGKSDLSEFDSLSQQPQMIVLMDKNALGASVESLTASYVKSMYDAVLRQRDAIIAEVIAVKPEIEIQINMQQHLQLIPWRHQFLSCKGSMKLL
jgi:Flp pilus assembly protein TadG